MSDFLILTESTCDLSPQLIKELNVVVIPMVFTIDDKNYLNTPDEAEMTHKQFYDLLRKEKSSQTSQVNVAQFIEVMEPVLQSGQDILYVAFSSGLSGTYNSSLLALEELRGKYPQRKIIAVDTLAASMGEGLMVYYAATLRSEGKSIDETADWLEKNKLNLCHWFTVDDLNHLKRGGRVSGAAALVGTMLGIKPVLHVDDEGHLIAMEKVRGRKQSLDALVQHLADTAINPSSQTVFISHGDSEDDCNYVAAEIKRKLSVKRVCTSFIGPVIGSHSGPGTIALFFIGTKR